MAGGGRARGRGEGPRHAEDGAARGEPGLHDLLPRGDGGHEARRVRGHGPRGRGGRVGRPARVGGEAGQQRPH